MKRLLFSLPIFLLFFNFFCVSTNVVILSENKRFAPTRPEEIEIYLSEHDIPGPYIKLALIFAEEPRWGASYQKMIKKMKQKAARLGANGLILEEIKNRVEVTSGKDNQLNLESEKVVKGIAIYVRK